MKLLVAIGLVSILVLSAGLSNASITAVTIHAPYLGTKAGISASHGVIACGSAKWGVPPFWNPNTGEFGFVARASNPGCTPKSFPLNTSEAEAYVAAAVNLSIPVNLTTGAHSIQAWWNLSWAVSAGFVKPVCKHPVKSNWYCQQDAGVGVIQTGSLFDRSNGSTYAPSMHSSYFSSPPGFGVGAGWYSYCTPCSSGTNANNSSSGSQGDDFGWNISGAQSNHSYGLNFSFVIDVSAGNFGQNVSLSSGSSAVRINFGQYHRGAYLSSIGIT